MFATVAVKHDYAGPYSITGTSAFRIRAVFIRFLLITSKNVLQLELMILFETTKQRTASIDHDHQSDLCSAIFNYNILKCFRWSVWRFKEWYHTEEREVTAESDKSLRSKQRRMWTYPQRILGSLLTIKSNFPRNGHVLRWLQILALMLSGAIVVCQAFLTRLLSTSRSTYRPLLLL